MTKFSSFKLDSIFEKIPTKKIKGKAKQFPDSPTDDYTVPLLTAGIQNQGLSRYAKPEQCPTILKNVISISANGANTGIPFFQDKEFSVLQDAYAIRLKNGELTRERGLYIVACLKKVLYGNFDWSNKAGWNNIKNMEIELPVKDNTNQFDFEYMEERIKELEEERIKELEAYLKVTGLKDFKLTQEEQKIIGGVNRSPIYRNFKIGELFSPPDKGDVDLQQSDIDNLGEYFINSGETNMGIKGKTSRPAKVFNANTITIDFFGNAYYRDYKYKLATHNHVFSFNDSIIKNKEVGLYLVTALKFLKSKYSYSNMLTWKKLKDDIISLPVDSNGNLDYSFMENYIKAMQKLTIKDVITYKDKVIGQTKEIIK
ncbi:restriction endonuclease subunit S [Limosilactobacillus fastidiosus]|uniref:Restriction endonuclease subunit S n=1 Tax=Limosilactobacillus fastidiosus TaxID=2759855 RepID=A0A7W3TZS6_9LACO|nr:restriction endonuclease subunit S [Limosilactobacillus fastidiosus]MBB1063332.1 restriction endonuclease subunit S [Limosilactobacillus fastidiosus]MBB1086306.1 restriction endonuclease subunit S [Limosilactobacillus fastidiosus]MCD7084497.1 restriction endonuclease subunit S [Limosilactobacillus fastidiosus]MCD7086410.1 restriction endonuclease subunit S [Limosilactobacillus fastidiosus]MCD7114234.1 restriction endonuclease subunit S [Limosilactobacillus fastidiosus]